MSKEEKYYCSRCGADLTKKPFNCYASEVDRKLICLDCFQKEQPKYLVNKIANLEAKLLKTQQMKITEIKQSSEPLLIAYKTIKSLEAKLVESEEDRDVWKSMAKCGDKLTEKNER